MSLFRRQPARRAMSVESVVNEPDIIKQWNALANIKDPELQFQLAQQPQWEIRNSLAKFNRQLTPEVQRILASDKHSYVRSNLAKHTAVPEVQSMLAKDRSSEVRLSLSGNPQLIEEAQVLLAQDQSRYVRRGLALQGNNLDGKVVEMLLKDKDSDVRWALAHSQNITDPGLLKALVQDRSSKVRIRVVERLGSLDQGLATELHALLEKDPAPEVRGALEYEDRYSRTMAELPKVMKRLRRDAYKGAIMRSIRGSPV